MKGAVISLGSTSSEMVVESMKKHFDEVDMIQLRNIEVRLGKESGIFYEGKLLKIELPNFINLKIKHTEPGIRGDTAKGGTKPATLETGAVVQVPLFVDTDDVIKIDTRIGAYIERITR